MHLENQASIRVILDVRYALNGVSLAEMERRLAEMCRLAVGEGLLTGTTDAEVEEYSIKTVISPACPTVVIEMEGSVIQRITADSHVRVILLDEDTEGLDDDRVFEVDERVVNIRDYHLVQMLSGSPSPESDGIAPEYVSRIAAEVDEFDA